MLINVCSVISQKLMVVISYLNWFGLRNQKYLCLSWPWFQKYLQHITTRGEHLQNTGMAPLLTHLLWFQWWFFSFRKGRSCLEPSSGWQCLSLPEWLRATPHMATVTSRLQVICTNTSTKNSFYVKPRNSDFISLQQACGTGRVWQSSCPKTWHPVIASGFNVFFLTINKMGRKFPTQVETKGQAGLVECRWEDPPAISACTHSWCLWSAAANTNTGRKGQCRELCSGPGSCAASTEKLCSSARSLSNVAWICQQKSSALLQKTLWSKVVQISDMKKS